MHLTTISEISQELNLSTRTLRYYEQIGLIQSVKKEGYAYRTYDEANVLRLRQILVLRKLRIPLKQVALILHSENATAIIDAFQQNLAEVDVEITALATIRDIIASFIDRLNESIQQGFQIKSLLDDTALLEAVDALTVQKRTLKDEKAVADLQQADETLNKLTARQVRIVYLPPATVAALHYIGDEPEHHAGAIMDKFVRESNLPTIKPDMRLYGFNHPNPGCIEGSDGHGYEFWVTIPADMEVPHPLVKKQFAGGLYAAHMIPMGGFDEWEWLTQWADNNEIFILNIVDDGGQCMYGLLEEHLNYRNNVATFEDGKYDDVQLDLLCPIKRKATT